MAMPAAPAAGLVPLAPNSDFDPVEPVDRCLLPQIQSGDLADPLGRTSIDCFFRVSWIYPFMAELPACQKDRRPDLVQSRFR
jgi:hypothetical protein